MRKLAFIAPVAAAMLMAGSAFAQPSSVVVTISPDFQKEVVKLGQREVDQQVADLTRAVERTLTNRNALEGAVINLTITDLKPNRPTLQQASDKPGLDMMRSLSIGGAAIEGTVTLASGEVRPVKYDYYSNNLQDAVGASTWWDANRAYDRLARNLAEGRFVSR